jgi:thiol-disulfide isomerase/thioredoxin
VVVLSFWATWCEPCARELPQLQALLDAERKRGLEVLAVNVGESAEVALPFARSLELSLPVGVADKSLREAFEVLSLPVVALIDRQGRVRWRWDGYRSGLEEQIVAQTRVLLSEDGPPTTEVGTFLAGGERLRVEWMREAPARVEGLAVLPQADTVGSVLVGAGRSLVLYDEQGRTVRAIKTPVSVGRLQASPVLHGGQFELLSFRPGGRDLLSVRFPGAAFEEWSVEAPVFDAACQPPTEPESEPSFLLASLDGLLRSGSGGRAASVVGTSAGGANSVVALGPRSAAGTAVLGLDGRIRWLDERGEATAESVAPRNAWSLIGGAATGTGVGAAPPGVIAAVVGRFLDEDEAQVALATEAGQLLILGTEEGRTLLRIRWEGISALAAGDLLADGRDELVVAAGRRVAVLAGPDSELTE